MFKTMICVKITFTIVILSVFVTAASMSKLLPQTMKAVGLYKYLPITDPASLVDVEVPLPKLKNSDVLVEVKAVAVNPIDTKIRAPKPDVETEPRILGWDGSGVVVGFGKDAKLFKKGDEVFFTGDLRRNGANAQYVALDEVQVGPKPKNLSYEQAAAMPLTSVTAYEVLVDRMLISEKDRGKSLLIINSAGGVGSVASQLAKLFGLKVIGTASRSQTQEFSQRYGADLVLNHSLDLIPQLKANGYDYVDYILVNYDPFPYWDTISRAIKPQGTIGLIVDSSGLVDLKAMKDKSITLVYEMMLTRIKYDTVDKFRHHEILKEVSRMLEEDKLKNTLTKTLSPINAANLRDAHRQIEDKHMIGKLVLSGF